MIPESHSTAVISTGLHFLRAITEAYGPDVGMRLWETIANTLDPDVKGQIFFAMLTGQTTSRVHFSTGASHQPVWAIKAIRMATGCGLKEAKDIYDMGKVKTVSVDVHTADDRRELIKCLRDAGCLVL